MASTKVTLKRFRADLVGYTQLKSGGSVQALLATKAEAVRAAADRLSGGEHTVAHKRGKFDMAYFVGTKDYRARRAQGKDKTLTKACNSIGGGS